LLLIHTHTVTHRNKYAFNLIFKDILGVDFALTSDRALFKEHKGAKISYTHIPVGDELFFCSRNLLFETGITDQNILIFEHNNTKVFYPTGKNSALPFDVFAASFYLVSRYEEYLPHIRDEHDRFEAKNSVAYANGFLRIPVVNIYAQWVKSLILKAFPSYSFPEKKYSFVSTIDIDNAYAYSKKGFIRSLGGYLRSLVSLDFDELYLRTQVLMNLKKDPYDTYEFQLQLLKQYKFKSIYFLLVGDYGLNDKNLSISNRSFQSLIKMLADYAQVGIHPSYGSNANKFKLKKEIDALSKVLHRDVVSSRQHFLKLKLPETYRNLIDSDIENDYTMGYSSDVGFRASICTPFNFYDLDTELETKLKVHPFAFMEGTLKYNMQIQPNQAMDVIKPLIEEVKKVDGVFISLWHNDSLNNGYIWKGWRMIYEDMVKYAIETTFSE
jgi:hypothetical protein